MSSSEDIAKKLDALWQTYLPAMMSRLAVVDLAIENLEAGCLNGELKLKAAHEAHKLAGSLGTFGLTASSAMSSRIEHLLSQPDPMHSTAAELRTLFDSIKRDIDSK